jgi:hypothetical protein
MGYPNFPVCYQSTVERQSPEIFYARIDYIDATVESRFECIRGVILFLSIISIMMGLAARLLVDITTICNLALPMSTSHR